MSVPPTESLQRVTLLSKIVPPRFHQHMSGRAAVQCVSPSLHLQRLQVHASRFSDYIMAGCMSFVNATAPLLRSNTPFTARARHQRCIRPHASADRDVAEAPARQPYVFKSSSTMFWLLSQHTQVQLMCSASSHMQHRRDRGSAVGTFMVTASTLSCRRELLLHSVNAAMLASLFTFGGVERPSSLGIQARRSFLFRRLSGLENR